MAVILVVIDHLLGSFHPYWPQRARYSEEFPGLKKSFSGCHIPNATSWSHASPLHSDPLLSSSLRDNHQGKDGLQRKHALKIWGCFPPPLYTSDGQIQCVESPQYRYCDGLASKKCELVKRGVITMKSVMKLGSNVLVHPTTVGFMWFVSSAILMNDQQNLLVITQVSDDRSHLLQQSDLIPKWWCIWMTGVWKWNWILAWNMLAFEELLRHCLQLGGTRGETKRWYIHT